MKKWVKQISIPQLIVEFASIVFAVSLALGMNAYKDAQDLKSEALVLKQKIILECKRNLTELDTVYSDNLKFKKSLDSLAALEKIEGNFNVGISSELLTKTAWDFTKASKSFSYLDEKFLNEAAIINRELNPKADLHCLVNFLAAHKYYGVDARKGNEIMWKYGDKV